MAPETSLVTRRHIIKGSSAQLPFVALNELCMRVASRDDTHGQSRGVRR
jgi:serine/threonine-protein kinase HipA